MRSRTVYKSAPPRLQPPLPPWRSELRDTLFGALLFAALAAIVFAAAAKGAFGP